MIDSRGALRRVGYNYLISNKREWNNCFIKKRPQNIENWTEITIKTLKKVTGTLTIFVEHDIMAHNP